MNENLIIFKHSELALAAYADLIVGDPIVANLTKAGMPLAQAVKFASNWRVVDQYDGKTEVTYFDEYGEEQTRINSTGLSATVFEDVTDGKRYLAIRGTEITDFRDIATDVIDVGILGTSQHQAQYAALSAKVQTWLDEGLLQPGFTVTGHSLGGFLATNLALEYPEYVTQTYLYNAPGVAGVGGNILSAIVNAFSPDNPVTIPDGLRISNIIATGDVVSSVGLYIAQPIVLTVEAQTAFSAHGIAAVTQSLAVYNLFSTIDPSLSVETISDILRSMTTDNNAVLHVALSAIGAIYGRDYSTTIANRENFYANLYDLQDALSGQETLKSLVDLSSRNIESLVQVSPAHLYSLLKLNPFVITSTDYSHLNTNGYLEIENYSAKYIADRAEMLYWKLQTATADAPADQSNPFSENGAPDVEFQDRSSGLTLTLGSSDVEAEDRRRVMFGGDGADVLVGANKDDALYGGLGNDFMAGGEGADRLEGGVGRDVLSGGAGNDTLDGGEGNDIYVFGANHGRDTISDLREGDGYRHGIIRYVGDAQTLIASGRFEQVEVGGDTFRASNGLTLTHGSRWVLTTSTGSIDLGADFISGDFGIRVFNLIGQEIFMQPETTREIVGDLQPKEFFDAEGNSIYHYDDLGNVVTDPDQPLTRDDLLHDSAGNDHIVSGGGDDTINLTAGGSDTVDAGAGNDTVQIQHGENHLVDLGSGDDEVYTALQLDTDLQINGGAGRDYLGAGAGDDLLEGGMGADGLYGGSGNDLIYGGIQGDAAEYIADGASQPASGEQGEWVDAENGDDQVFTGAGNDLIAGGDGNDLIVSGGGNDWIFGDWNSVSPIGDWRNWSVSETVSNGNYSYKILNLYNENRNGSGDDTIYAGAGNDVALGEAGNDTLYMEGGNDRAWGGEGADVILGDSGDDVLNGDNGLEALDESRHGDDFIDGGDGSDLLYGAGGADLLFGGAGNDGLFGDYSAQQVAGDDYLDGEDGNDFVCGGGGKDTLLGGAGNDELYGEDLDTPEGQHAADDLFGGTGADRLVGCGGNDRLFGEDGDDVLDGDTGGLAEALYGDDLLDGGAGNDTLIGNGGSDILLGGDGNDRLYGEASDTPEAVFGDDFLDGGAGNDILVGGGGSDTLVGDDGDDQLTGDAADLDESLHQADRLDGGSGNDTLVGNGGDDILLGGSGNDSLYGGQGNDRLEGGLDNDVLNGNEGNDQLYGDDGDDTLIGGAGDDLLSGGAGDDLLVAGVGVDIVEGGAGHDTYIYQQGDGRLVIRDDGSNTLIFGAGIASDTISLGLGSLRIDTGVAGDEIHIENFDPEDVFARLAIDRFQFANGTVLTYAELIARGFELRGTDGNDVIEGTSVADRLQGFAGADTIIAKAGNDLLDGGAGADILRGGVGDDVYLVDNAGDRVEELLDEGTDEVRANVDYTLTANVESLLLTGAAVSGVGNELDNRLTGSSGDNYLSGLAGDDVLSGGNGNDWLDGGAGADIMHGGDGDDTYSVDHISDVTTEAYNQQFDSPESMPPPATDLDYYMNLFSGLNGNSEIDPVAANAGANRRGHDTVISSVSHELNGYMEDLYLTGSDHLDGRGNLAANRIVGNAGNNLLDGWIGDDTLDGQAGDDVLLGGDGNDVLHGGAGNDLLDGGSGNDTLAGGSGDDLYRLDNSGDTVLELAGEGVDTAEAGFDITLAEHVENLRLTGNAIRGTGNAGANRIIGNSAMNILDGGAGADILAGGVGSDTYYVDNAADQIIENASSGYDQVFSSVSHSLAENVEYLTLTGSAAIDGFGNGLVNQINGNSATNLLRGGDGDDRLAGGAGNDRLYGDAGDDSLDGGAGADLLVGGAGNDRYYVDDAADQVEELAGEGIDEVFSSVSHTLAVQVENLTLSGTASIDGRGNVLNNVITGNASDNVLDGGAGDDLLDGDAGADLLIGGSGDDLYRVDNAGDQIIERSGEGYDQVESSSDYTLTAHVEQLQLVGADAINGTGNSQDNYLLGNNAANRLDGLAGDDLLDGGAGNDELYGGDGVDSLYGGADAVEYFSEYGGYYDYGGYVSPSNNDLLDGGAGNDWLDGGSGDDLLFGGDGDDVLYGGDDGQGSYSDYGGYAGYGGYGNTLSNNDVLDGGAGDDLLSGGSGSDLLLGGEGTDTLDGGDGDDVLDGETGIDVLIGGSGNDVYYVDGKTVVSVVSGDGAPDEHSCSGCADHGDDDHKNHDCKGNEGVGNGADPPPPGHDYNMNDGAGTAPGSPGSKGEQDESDHKDEKGDDDHDAKRSSDRHSDTACAQDAQPARQSADECGDHRGCADDHPDHSGHDGKKSDDEHACRTKEVQCTQDEHDDCPAGGAARLGDSGAGETVVVTSVTDTVIEQADGGYDLVCSSVSYQLTDHVEELQLLGDDDLDGTGNDLDNLIYGNSGSNRLDGGGGGDFMLGGSGDDTYVVDSIDDEILEFAGDGYDRVEAAIHYTLGDQLEALTLTGTDSLNGVGNGLDNRLAGNSGDNLLQGLGGNDVLDGGAGNDRLEGGSGDDLYLYQRGDGLDTVVDSEGINAIRFGTGIAAGDIVIRLVERDGQSIAEIRLLDAQGSTLEEGLDVMMANGTWPLKGLEFADGSVVAPGELLIQSRTWTGSQKSDRLITGHDDDTILAGAGNDKVVSGAGNDSVYGQTGNDQLDGGSGHDRLYGGDGQDVISGGYGNDLLVGGPGQDRLSGGFGADTYLFNRGDGVDRVDLESGAGADDVDRLLFGADVDPAAIALMRLDKDLVIGYGADDQVTIRQFFDAERGQQLDTVACADGRYLDHVDIDALIGQMAAYAVQDGSGFNPVDTVRRDDNLMTLVAGAWHTA